MSAHQLTPQPPDWASAKQKTVFKLPIVQSVETSEFVRESKMSGLKNEQDKPETSFDK